MTGGKAQGDHTTVHHHRAARTQPLAQGGNSERSGWFGQLQGRLVGRCVRQELELPVLLHQRQESTFTVESPLSPSFQMRKLRLTEVDACLSQTKQ